MQQVTSAVAVKRWLGRKAKRTLIYAAVAVPLALGVRAAVAEEFYVPGNAVAPEVPQNARVLVYKLAHSYTAGDIVVFHNDAGLALVGRVVSTGPGPLTLGRDGQPNFTVPLRQVVGRVVLTTR